MKFKETEPDGHQAHTNQSTLFATLPSVELKLLTPIVQQAVNSGSLSAQQLLQQLQNQGTSAPIFPPLRNYFAYVEQVRYQTYSIDGDITIGMGLDLTKNSKSAEALFYALDPTRNWNFTYLFTEPGYPKPALNLSQVNQLFCLSITGVNNQDGSFIGYGSYLVSALGSLSNTVFQANQLIALMSLVFNGGKGLIGSHMLQALTDMLKMNSDLEPLQQIIEYSNRKYNPGLQNRRLKDAAMFHGNGSDPELDVHITWRQYKRLLASQKTTQIKLIGGPVKWGVPTGQLQQSFVGNPNVTIFQSGNPNAVLNEPTYFGTPQNDSLILTANLDSGSPIFYGGDGSDILFFNNTLAIRSARKAVSSQYESYVYYAGGVNEDIYFVNNIDNYFIYDADNKGIIILSQNNFCDAFLNTNLSPLLGGPIINNAIDICGISLNVTEKTESDGSTTFTIEENSLVAGQIAVANYIPGQFNLLPGGYTKTLTAANYNPIINTVTSDGRVILIGPLAENEFLVYNVNGTLLNQFQIVNFTTPIPIVSNIIATFDGNLFASVVYQGLNDTLLAGEFDGKSNNYTLQEIAVQPRENCGVSDCTYMSTPNTVPLTTGGANIVLLSLTYSPNFANLTSCSLDAYIKNSKVNIATISNNCASIITTLNTWPIFNGGFLISYSSEQNVYTALECNAMGKVVQQNTFNCSSILAAGPIQNGYVVALFSQLQSRIYTLMYQTTLGWLPELSLINTFISLSALIKPLGNYVYVFLNPNYGFILNTKNQFIAGPFGVIPNIQSAFSANTQSNGDIVMLTEDSFNFYVSLLKTSFLNQNASNDEKYKTPQIDENNYSNLDFDSDIKYSAFSRRKLLSVSSFEDSQTSSSNRNTPFLFSPLMTLFRTADHFGRKLAFMLASPAQAKYPDENIDDVSKDSETKEFDKENNEKSSSEANSTSIPQDLPQLTLDFSHASKTTVVHISQRLTLIQQRNIIHVVDETPNIVKGSKGNNILVGGKNTVLDVSASTGENILVPGENNTVRLSKGRDHVVIKKQAQPTRVTIQNFASDDIIHITGPTPIISQDGRSLCHDKNIDGIPTALIETSDSEVHLPQKQCKDLGAGNVRVNEEPATLLETAKEILAAPEFGSIVYSIGCHAAAGLLLFKREIMESVVTPVIGKENVKKLEEVVATPEAETVMTALELGLRHAAPADAVVAYDFGDGFKKGFNQEKSQDPQDAIDAGFRESLANVVCRHTLLSRFTALGKIAPETIKGYRRNGFLGAIDSFAEAAVEIIPGHSVVTRQWPKEKPKTFFKLPEPKDNNTEAFPCGLRRRKPSRHGESNSNTDYRCTH